MTADRPEDIDDESGAETRQCAVCGHAEDEHRVITDTPERGRPEVCLICNNEHAFEARPEDWPAR